MARAGRSRNVVARVVGWLRAGYPDGVPQQDYVALLGILHRQLSDDEIITIAQTIAGSTVTDVEERIRLAIRRKTLQPATDDEVARVSARLAKVGWPLAVVDFDTPDESEQTEESETADPTAEPVVIVASETRTVIEVRASDSEARRNIMKRLITWVRQGYPTGVPAADYVPLIALLSRRLTKDEVIDIVIELRGASVLPSETGRIGAAIMGTTNEVPSIEEIERVRHHLSEVTGADFSED
ncbi:MAG TPA: DUF3349 domain-containing protein [Propionibacteriaceae bacterium]